MPLEGRARPFSCGQTAAVAIAQHHTGVDRRRCSRLYCPIIPCRPIPKAQPDGEAGRANQPVPVRRPHAATSRRAEQHRRPNRARAARRFLCPFAVCAQVLQVALSVTDGLGDQHAAQFDQFMRLLAYTLQAKGAFQDLLVVQ